MSRLKETTTPGDTAPQREQVHRRLAGQQVCPYCGHPHAGGADPCPHCTMEDSPATRQATKARIGPWYVLQSRNPAAPGMKYATLLALIQKGHVTPRSIVRGPTTYQLWRYAAHVRGVSREFEVCYSCGKAIERTDDLCPHCQRRQEPPADPDVLVEVRTIVQPGLDAPSLDSPSYADRMRELKTQRSIGEEQAALSRPRTEVVRRTDGHIVSAVALAEALQTSSDQVLPAPKRWFLKSVITILLLAALAGGGVLYFMPEYRAPTRAWLDDHWATIKTKWNAIDWPKISNKPLPPRSPSSPPVPPAPIAASPTKPQVVVPVREVAVEKPTAALAAPAQPTVVEEVAPAPVDPEAQIEKVRQLWGQAIDAEAHQDFAGAVRLYDQIKKIPNTPLPAGLQLRLDAAQRRVKQPAAR